MSFTNVNDPAGVKALLDQLRSSQAWQDVVSAGPSSIPVASVTQATPSPSNLNPSQPGESPTNSVASLLSQLQSSPSLSSAKSQPVQAEVVVADPRLASTSTSSYYPTTPSSFISPSSSDAIGREDVKSFTFQQALPRLGLLSENPAFVAAVAQLKREQDDLERKLWAEREAIHEKYQDKIKVAKTKAAMLGVAGISKHEAKMMNQAFEVELRKFDSERVLPAWDSLISSQQAALASHRVPTMFPTTSVTDRERQQRVIQVLEGIVGNES